MDAQIGRIVRRKRLEAGMTLSDMAAQIGISYQQLQKHERGIDCIGAARLFLISKPWICRSNASTRVFKSRTVRSACLPRTVERTEPDRLASA
mgnify:CR=1 FL=1